MDCRSVQNEIPAILDGETPVAGAREHIDQCPSCMGEMESLAQLRALIRKDSPPVEPPAGLYGKIESRLPQPIRRGSFFAPVAAAALLLLAATVYVVYQSNIVRLAAVTNTGERILTGARYTATTETVLTMPRRGALYLRGGTELLFSAPDRLDLAKGTIFASIIPGKGGFTLHTKSADCVVLGTSFGVETGEGKETLLSVKEGKVRFANERGSITVNGGSSAVATEGSAPAVTANYRAIAPSQWVRPSLKLSRSPAGANLFELLIRNETPIPIFIPPVDRPTSYLFLKIASSDGGERLINLNAANTSVLDSPVIVNKLGMLDISSFYRIQCTLDPGLFSRPGGCEISARYANSSPSVDREPSNEIWAGIVESNVVEVPREK